MSLHLDSQYLIYNNIAQSKSIEMLDLKKKKGKNTTLVDNHVVHVLHVLDISVLYIAIFSIKKIILALVLRSQLPQPYNSC